MKIQITVEEARTLIATISQARAAVLKKNPELADNLDEQWFNSC
jgi:hypothetical protein